MKLHIKHSIGPKGSHNISPVLHNDVEVGEAKALKHYSGWHGGGSIYMFYPNKAGIALGLRWGEATTQKALLSWIQRDLQAKQEQQAAA